MIFSTRTLSISIITCAKDISARNREKKFTHKGAIMLPAQTILDAMIHGCRVQINGNIWLKPLAYRSGPDSFICRDDEHARIQVKEIDVPRSWITGLNYQVR
jgi:hypothetical protein